MQKPKPKPFRPSKFPVPAEEMTKNAPAVTVSAPPENLETCSISLLMATRKGGSVKLPPFHFRGLVNGSPVSFVVSTGSTHSFIKQEAVERTGLHLSSTIPKLCEQRYLSAPCFTLGTVVAPVIIQGYESSLALEVLPFITVVDVVLGVNWISSIHGQTEFHLNAISFPHGGRIITLKSDADEADSD